MAKYPTRFQQRTVWNAAAGLSMLVIGGLIVGLILLMGRVLGFLQPVLLPLAVAGIMAYLLDPLVSWCQRRGMSRVRAVLTVFASALVATSLALMVVIPMVSAQVDEFQTRAKAAAPTAAPNVKPFDERVVESLLAIGTNHQWMRPVINHLLSPAVPAQGPSALPVVPQSSGAAQQDLPGPPVDLPRVDNLQETVLWAYAVQYAEELQVFLFSWLKGGASMIISLLGIILGVVMVPIYLYYFLRESAAIKDSWHIYVPLRASRFKDEVVGTVAEINGYLLSFFRGQMLVAFIDGILIGIALTIFRLPLGLPIGILVCFLGIIPYVGSIICLIPACVLAYFHFSVGEHQHVLGANPWSYVGGVVVIFIVVNQVNSLFTSPRIVGSSVGLHPMTVIFSMLFWTLLLGGFLGALLAVPLTAAVKVLIRRYIWERKLNSPDQPDGPERPRGNGKSGLIFES